MNLPLRVGVIDLIHDHAWDNLPQLVAASGAELVAVSEDDPQLRERAASEFHIPAYEDANEMLAEEDIDAVYIFSSNAEGADWATQALELGLHVMIEKPMASHLDEADQMMAAARESGARLMINWPFIWCPRLQHAIAMAQSGAIGKVWQVKYRAAHAGPKELGCSEAFCDWLFDQDLNGAGALMDYCCYGVALARVLMGVPSRVSGVRGRFLKEDILVDDNAILTMTYPNGLAVAEGSWTQIGNLSSYGSFIYGTEGTLVVEPGPKGRLLHATSDNPDGVEVDAPTLSDELQNSAKHFVWAVTHGEPFHPLAQDRVGRDAQEILEAGLLSAIKRKEVSLPLT